MRESLRNAMIGGGLLAAFAIAGVAIVALTWQSTAERIEQNERQVLSSALNEIIPPQSHDNDMLHDRVELEADPLLGSRRGVAYLAYRENEPVAILLTATAPDGYNGDIRLLIGIWADGRIAGVRVLSHKETPGLGDPIEIERSGWIRSFNGKSLDDPPVQDWRVRKDGGIFDQFTGATITPRAVVRAVKNALIYFEKHRDRLLPRP